MALCGEAIDQEQFTAYNSDAGHHCCSSLACGRMYTHEEALTAKKALNGSAFNGRSIFIKW